MKRSQLKLSQLALASAIVLASCGAKEENKSAYKKVETVAPIKNEVNIPYTKYEFDNGLTLLVHEDNSDPIVHVDVTYHVGSAREEKGRSGFAHFFEHMMFQGSDNVADEEHFKIISEAGGTLNGTTNADRTNYFETMPSNQLETALWLEADRMGFLLDAVTQQKFEVQRGTVKNERGQNYDNRPYGLAFEKIFQAIYPYGHPYSWPTIGYIEDLNRVTVEDLKKFFLRWYGPNNAVLTVAGDVKSEDVAGLVDKYFGNIPRGPEVVDQKIERNVLDSTRYISYEDSKVRTPRLYIAYPTVATMHPDEAALDILVHLIAGDKNSAFYDVLTKSKVASSAYGYDYFMELAGNTFFQIDPMPSRDGSTESLAFIEDKFFEALRVFEEKGVKEEDINRFKSSTEAYMIKSLASVSGKASSLASYATFQGNPNLIGNDIKRYMDVTVEDVMRVYNKYIKDKPAVVLSIYPTGKSELIAASDNFTPKMPDPAEADHKEYKGLVYNKAIDDSTVINRSVKPAKGANPVVKVPPFWKKDLKNGVKIIGTQNTEIPLTTVRLSVDCGHHLESVGQAGIADLTAKMMNESTEQFTSEEVASQLESLGSSISVYGNQESIVISVTSLTKNMDKTMEIAEQVMFHPAFNEEDFNRVKRIHVAGLKRTKTSARSIASLAINRVIYPEESIFSIPNGGTVKTASSLTIEDVKAFYEQNFSPSIARVVAVSDLKKGDLEKKLTVFTEWEKKETSAPVAVINAKQVDKTKIVFIDQKGAAQSEIRLVKMALPFDASGDYYKHGLMNFNLAGNFNSRLNLYIREAKNWSYGTAGRFNGRRYAAPYMIYGGILQHATDSAINTYISEIREYQANGITDEELAFMKSSIGQKDALKYETGRQKAGFISTILKYELSPDFKREQTAVLESITKEEINALANDFYNLDEMIIIVVGDKEQVGEKVKAIADAEGFDFEELSIDQVVD